MSNNTENFINLFLCIGLTYPQGLPQCYRVTARRHLLTTKSTGIPDPLYRNDYQQTCASFDCHGSKSSHHYRVFSWGLVSGGGGGSLVGGNPCPHQGGETKHFPNVADSVSLRIQSKCGKIRTRKNSVFGQFSHADWRTYLMEVIMAIQAFL